MEQFASVGNYFAVNQHCRMHAIFFLSQVYVKVGLAADIMLRRFGCFSFGMTVAA